MANTMRHFGKLVGSAGNGEEIIIIGHSPKDNQCLVVVVDALTSSEQQMLRGIVSSPEAQGKDYLMDVISGSVLAKSHHPSGTDWQTYLIKMGHTGRGRLVRPVSLKDIMFFDDTQKAFYGGYGPSVEPDVDKRRKAHARAKAAHMSGQALPEPTEEEIRAAGRSLGYTDDELGGSTPKAPPAPDVPSASDVLMKGVLDALTAITQQQAAMSEALAKLQAPTPQKEVAKRPRKVPMKKAAAPSPAAPEPLMED